VALNPFVELVRDPVGTLAVIGTALVLAGVALSATWWSLRQLGVLAVRYRSNRHTEKWWSGPLDVGVVPPPDWTARLVAVLFVWAVALWALGAIVYLIG
jgi:hypothetical protein